MRWFNNIKIRNKLLIVFGILLSIAVFFTIFAIVSIIDVGKNLEELINSYQKRQMHLGEAIADVYRIRLINLSKGYLFEEDLEEIVFELHIDLDENIRLFTDNLAAYRDLVESDARLTESEKQGRLVSVNEIMDLFNRYVEMTRGLDSAARNKDKQELLGITAASIHTGNELSLKVRELRDRIFTTTMQKASETQNVTYHTINIIIFVSAAFILLSVLTLLFTVRNINKPITNLEKAMVEIAKGNMSCPIRSERKDELGTLANCVGDMINELEKLNEKRQQEELLHEALNAAKMASAAKSSFLANMSHEIRTPMNVVLGITEILLQKETLPPDIREAVCKINNSGDLLLSIINDILDLSKIEAGRLELSPHKYEVASLINDTVTLNMMRIGSKPIEFILSVDENIPSTLTGDDLRIKQIMNNLLSNAFKYTEEGVVKLAVSAKPLMDHPAEPGNPPGKAGDGEEVALIFVVSDTGQGMSEEQVQKLFDEYTRFNSEANRTTEGTGLGMSIVRNLVEMMSGTISVESEVDKGTIFTASLPQVGAGSGVLGKRLAESLQNFNLNDLKQQRKAQIVYEPMPYGKVLVVDDAESNLYVAQGLMAPYELTIETAGSGFDAIKKIKAGNIYDIVFMDHMMPVMDGIEATSKIRDLGYHHPVVALTANAVTGQEEVFLTSGFDGFISKPIDMRQLNAALKRFVRDKQPPEVVKAARQKAGSHANDICGAPEQLPAQSQLHKFFVNDANKAIATLEELLGVSDAYTQEDVKLFTTSVHAMKSALANIGESELSSFAARLEHAGRNSDTDTLTTETPDFLSRLRALVKSLTPPEQTAYASETSNGDISYLRERMLTVKEACKTYDKRTIKEIINELTPKAWPHQTKQLLDTMSEQLLNGDFDKVSLTAEMITESGLSL